MPSPFVFCVHVGVEGGIFLVNIRERERGCVFLVLERESKGEGERGVFV